MVSSEETSITHVIEDYLKAIFKLQSGGERVTTTALAQQLDVSPASVTKMVKRLAELGLLEHTPYQGVTLTGKGKRIALEVIRRHRLFELYLTQVMGLPWDQVHSEAERIEHVLSEHLEKRIEEILGYPLEDPHGDPIPNKDLEMPDIATAPLSELEEGEQASIRRVSDHDPECLRYLASLGLVPRATVEVLEKAPFKGPIRLKVGGSECVIGRELASTIYVSRLSSEEEG